MEVLHKDFWTDKNEAQFRKMMTREILSPSQMVNEGHLGSFKVSCITQKYYCPESMLENGPSQRFLKFKQSGLKDQMLIGVHQ